MHFNTREVHAFKASVLERRKRQAQQKKCEEKERGDSMLRFSFLIVGSFMVFCFDFLIRKKIDTKFIAKSILWMICRMRIKLGVPFWKILYDWVQNLLRQIYFVSFTFLMLKKKKNEFYFLYINLVLNFSIFFKFLNRENKLVN